jgi:hypothetical protein
MAKFAKKKMFHHCEVMCSNSEKTGLAQHRISFFPGQMTVLCCDPVALLPTTGKKSSFLAVAQCPF